MWEKLDKSFARCIKILYIHVKRDLWPVLFILIDIENSPKLLSWLLIVRNQVLEAKESKVDNSFFFFKSTHRIPCYQSWKKTIPLPSSSLPVLKRNANRLADINHQEQPTFLSHMPSCALSLLIHFFCELEINLYNGKNKNINSEAMLFGGAVPQQRGIALPFSWVN